MYLGISTITIPNESCQEQHTLYVHTFSLAILSVFSSMSFFLTKVWVSEVKYEAACQTFQYQMYHYLYLYT